MQLKVATMLGIHLGQSRHYERQCEHASDCCQFYALCAKWAAEGESCWNMPGHSRGLERETEFLSKMITGAGKKHSSSHLSWRVYHLHAYKGWEVFIQHECHFSVHGVLLYEFVPQEHTVNHDYFMDILWCVWENVWWKQPEKWNLEVWFFYHDIVPLHSALSRISG